MEKFASTRRANRWQNKGSPLCCLIPEPRAHPLSHLPTLHRTATLIFYRAVILDTDLCTMLCFIHDRVLAPPSDFSDYRTGGSLTEENSLISGLDLLSVLSGPAERLSGIPHRRSSILLCPQMVASFYF